MPVSLARKIAFDVLRRVAVEGAYASDLLHKRLGPSVARADAGLATEITLGVLRWQRLLDFLLSRHLDQPIERLDLEVLLALRLGLYQLRYLARVPAHAAVGESVELTKGARKRSAAALVNAVLRHSAPEAKASGETLEKYLPLQASAAERSGILYSHPTWIVERWMAAFGNSRTGALLEANNRTPPLSCTIIRGHDAAEVTESLRADGIAADSGRWLHSALILSGGNATATTAFRLGQISIQDEASQMVGYLLDARPGQTVLDVCAAPGGKTRLLAGEVAPDGVVIAADLHGHRLRSMREQLARTETQNVVPMALDATRPLPFARRFDRILVDAPCSGTGTLSRNPEIRWRLAPDDLKTAHQRQTAMMRNALAALAPGGRLVYSTCSLEAEENESVVFEALADDAGARIVSRQSAAAALSPHLRDAALATGLFDNHGFFRTFPPESQSDGFFAVTLERSR